MSQLTTDDIVDAMCLNPGDLVAKKSNFEFDPTWGIGLVIYSADGGVSVMWCRAGKEPKIIEHNPLSLVKLSAPGHGRYDEGTTGTRSA